MLQKLRTTPDQVVVVMDLLRLQTLERFRFELVTQIGAQKQRVIGVLDRIFPEYEKLFSDVSFAVLGNCCRVLPPQRS